MAKLKLRRISAVQQSQGTDASFNTAHDIVHNPLVDRETAGTKIRHKKMPRLTPKQQGLLNQSLMDAVHSQRWDKAILFLKLGADVDSHMGTNTALMVTAWFGQAKIVKLFIKKGANVNIQDGNGKTALMYAAGNFEFAQERTKVVKVLIDNGANVDIQDKEGKTALMHATMNVHTETVKYLLSIGADPFLENNYGETAHDLTRIYDLTGIEEIREFLMAFGNIWERTGKEQTVVLVQDINAAIKECSPARMKETFGGL